MDEPHPEPPRPTLEFLETRELVEEIAKRHKSFIMACVTHKDDMRISFSGGRMNAIGLAEWLKVNLLSEDSLPPDADNAHGYTDG